MNQRISVQRTMENAETIRKAREIAWIAVLLIALSPVGFTFKLVVGQRRLDPVESLLFVVAPLLICARLVHVATQLGKNLKDHEFVARMESGSFPLFYLVGRFAGLTKSTD